MSIFGVDWDMDGKVDDMDLATDLFIIDEIEKEERENQKNFDSDFEDDFDSDYDD